MSINVSLTPELERFVEEQIATGRFASANDVVYEALRALQANDEERRSRFEELKREIRIGVEEADRGEVVAGDEVFRQLRARVAEIEQQQS